MQYKIAICLDDYTNPKTLHIKDAFSSDWIECIEKAGHIVKLVDVKDPNILEQLKGCHGFMWRWAHFGGMGRIARRLLPVIEKELDMMVWPDQNTCWHYDDKIAQHFILKANNIPTPETHVFFDYEKAAEWLQSAQFPIVLKLASGAGSSNVRLLKNKEEALLWLNRLFKYRFTRLDSFEKKRSIKRLIKDTAKLILYGNYSLFSDDGLEPQSGYAYFQEFLPGNDYDIRIVVVGDYAWGFRRFNRSGDFRASGSGFIDITPKHIPTEAIKLAFEVSERLKTQCLAYDILFKNDSPVIVEISYTFVAKPMGFWPGYWTRGLNFKKGNLDIPTIQTRLFLGQLEKKYI